MFCSMFRTTRTSPRTTRVTTGWNPVVTPLVLGVVLVVLLGLLETQNVFFLRNLKSFVSVNKLFIE